MAIAKTKKKAAAVKKTVKSAALKTKKNNSAGPLKKGNAKMKNNVSKVIKPLKKSAAIKFTDKKLSRTYLKDRELKFFKELIMEQKAEILENASKLRESLIDNAGDYVGDNSTFSMHMAEQGSDEMEREKAYMFVQRDEKHLFYLENALERIAKKTYGLCISCGRPITKARLEAVPITSHCINCKQNLSS